MFDLDLFYPLSIHRHRELNLCVIRYGQVVTFFSKVSESFHWQAELEKLLRLPTQQMKIHVDISVKLVDFLFKYLTFTFLFIFYFK